MKTKSLRQSPNDHYKARVKAIKKRLPKNVRAMVFELHPQYLTVDGIALLNNVISGSSSCMLLTEVLEQIAKQTEDLKAAEVLNTQKIF